MLWAGVPGYSQVPAPPGYVGPVLADCSDAGFTGGEAQVYETSPSVLTIQFTASPSLGSNVQMQVLLDGTAVGTSTLLTPGQSITPITTGVVATGFHTITFRSTFQTCIVVGEFQVGTTNIAAQVVAVPALSAWGTLLLAALLTGLSAGALGGRFQRQNG